HERLRSRAAGFVPAARLRRPLLAEAVDGALDRADDQAAGGHGGRADDLAVPLDLLNQRSLVAVQDVEVPVLRADIDALADHHRRRVNAAPGQVAPDLIAGLAVQPVDALVLAGGNHQVAGYRHRGEEGLLPPLCLEGPLDLAVLPVDSLHLVRHFA